MLQQKTLIVILLVFFGCSGDPQKDKIVIPKQPANFYSIRLYDINKKLKTDPQNELLIDQKLYYCEELEWPTSCIDALDMYQQKKGMTNWLIKQYILYYRHHEQHEHMLMLIDQWNNVYDLKNEFTFTYIDCLTQLEKYGRSKAELRELLRMDQSLEKLIFASEQYMIMKDTMMAMYILSKIRKLNPNNELMWEYGNFLFKMDNNYRDMAIEVLDNSMLHKNNKKESQLNYAKMLESAGYRHKAREMIKPFYSHKDTTTYLLSDWYQKDFMWDSATHVIKQLIIKDSTNRKAFLRIGNLYEERGLLLTSLPYYKHLMKLNPNDTLTQQKIDRVLQKIAYLRRLKFERDKTPTLELQPKTIKD